ncbi:MULTISPECIES: N,N'-diacetylbacillosaminyl-diphospho-undecaprenol alpha-1,3-N-acetylgalactosaminyltransferase [Campylobacter]|uniref:N, N'-diacetylbacillosaminyl-diphospho-undecaprenol alpha-1,3-N-acetylgalactosaminyltransferase n=1 Tax=Campylobacter TaxID=194 RepID=UPI000A32F21A|nr:MULTISPECIES: N,N'-diacetylbacillosaminyl-diphospho-undecaprenol alpha-1,3-N-acetylgalactosaminyltransferase [unclassified Campylobacter]MCR8678878.1 N,N'-diacetylbacillosaminyl-diphospho-undecaprenol alpha-1,3-N-acetylgalactosaminyltransferase [Campylobacter sp. RM19072]MCR8695925.1 N,N'-diacetylbacillosaminyl-diphospho-undecaprenol alpha-1,3-N-acetylgalactosaminyltransferase [Campylobacter sp. RM19073]
MKIGFLSHSDMSIYHFRLPIMQALKDLGHEVIAIVPKGSYNELIKAEFRLINYDIDKASLNPFRVFKDTKNLTKLLKSLNLDLIQTSAHKSNIFGTLAAKRAGIKYIVNLVEGLGSFYTSNSFKNIAVRYIIEILYFITFRLSNATIFVNDSDPNYMLNHHLIPKSKVIRIKSVGVDANKFNPQILNPYNFNSDKKIILMVARALKDKGVMEFYQAARILKDRDDCQFVFVGSSDPNNPSSIDESFLSSTNVTHISWSDEIANMLVSCYMFVLPSYKEGFARTILEAMSMAKPSVVSNCDGCVEAIDDGVSGLICKIRDPVDLANKIATLLDDSLLATKMGKNARDIVLANYNQPLITTKYIKFYKALAGV